MSWKFKFDQLSQKKLPVQSKNQKLLESETLVENQQILENRDEEIYALRQQLQSLKNLYKNVKSQKKTDFPKACPEVFAENEYSRQRIEKLMAVLAEREKQIWTLQREAKQQHASAIDAWQKERQEKLLALEEVAALQQQLQMLKEKLTSLRESPKG